MEYLEINEVREIDGMKIQCLRGGISCGCPSSEVWCCLIETSTCRRIACVPHHRQDGEHVYFVKTEDID